MEGFARHDPVLNVLGVRMTNLGAKPAPNVRYAKVCSILAKPNSLRRPLHLLPDAARGASLTQPGIPQLYLRILRPFYEVVAPATVCELCITASVSDQSQATVPPTLREAVRYS